MTAACPKESLPIQIDEQAKEGQVKFRLSKGTIDKVVQQLDDLTGMADVWSVIQHEAVDATGEQRRGDAVTGDIAHAHDDVLVALEMNGGIVAAHADHRVEVAHDFEVAPSLVGGDHAAMHALGDL